MLAHSTAPWSCCADSPRLATADERNSRRHRRRIRECGWDRRDDCTRAARQRQPRRDCASHVAAELRRCPRDTSCLVEVRPAGGAAEGAVHHGRVRRREECLVLYGVARVAALNGRRECHARAPAAPPRALLPAAPAGGLRARWAPVRRRREQVALTAGVEGQRA